MSKKVLFFDIDGTILPKKGEIPESAISAIAKARENGHICLVNTGRPYKHIDPKVFAITFDGYICSCGGFILLNGERLQHVSFSTSESLAIDAKIQECGLDAGYESEDGIWYRLTPQTEPNYRWAKEYFRSIGLHPDEKIGPNFRFDKFCVWFPDGCNKEEFRRFISPTCTVIDREHLWEITKSHVSKQTGIQMVLEKLEVSLEDSYAFGDSANDLPMLRCVGHSVAMGEAPQIVKDEVEYVTDGIMEDGLYKALSYFGLIE